MRSALIVVLVTLVVAALSALPALWAAREAVLHDRAEQDWRAVNQQWLAITEPDLVDRWPVAIGISLPTIASAFRSIEGSTVTFETGALSGTVLTLGDVVLRPGVAGVDATARLTAERGRFLEVDIGVEGSLVVAGLAATRDDDGRRVVKVRIALVPDRVRLEGRRALAFFWLRGFWSSLAAVVVEHYASERLAFDASVPAEFSVEIPKGFDGRADIGAAEVGYHAAIPAIASSALLDYVYAIVGDRIWLLGRPVGEPPGAPGTPAIEAPPDGATRDQLIADSRTMREAINRSATLARSPTKVPQIDVILGKQLAALATADLLSGRTHTLTVRTTAVDGSLAEADTGKGTVLLPRMSAKLGMCASCGALEIGLAGRLAWDADGMRLALEPTAKAEATLAVTIDPGPGGGLPPRKLTLSGNGAAMISPTLSLGIIDPDRAPIAALDIRADCTPINFELAGAPADGPMVMPAAGARLELPLSLERMPPIVLLDTRPRFVALALPQLPTGIALRLAAAGVEVVATPRLAEIGDDRITMAADLALTPRPAPQDSQALATRITAATAASAAVAANVSRDSRARALAARGGAPGAGLCGLPSIVPTLSLGDKRGIAPSPQTLPTWMRDQFDAILRGDLPAPPPGFGQIMPDPNTVTPRPRALGVPSPRELISGAEQAIRERPVPPPPPAPPRPRPIPRSPADAFRSLSPW